MEEGEVLVPWLHCGSVWLPSDKAELSNLKEAICEICQEKG